jgi:hypothetical protein
LVPKFKFDLYVGISNKLLLAIWKFLPQLNLFSVKQAFLTRLVKNTQAGYFLLVQPTLTDNQLFLAHSHKFFSPLLLPSTAASGLIRIFPKLQKNILTRKVLLSHVRGIGASACFLHLIFPKNETLHLVDLVYHQKHGYWRYWYGWCPLKVC